MSSNIRFDNPQDGKQDWQGRQKLLSSLINEYNPAILGTQEGRQPQIKNLEESLSHLTMIDSHRSWISERMYPTLFINTDIVDCLESRDIWLSETPDVPGSSSFESAFPRLATAAILRGKDSKREWATINMHLDHVKAQTRLAQARVLVEQIQKFTGSSLPLIVMGDFNESPEEDVRKELMIGFPGLRDPWKILGKKEEGTHHKFDGDNSQAKRIDWILPGNGFEIVDCLIDKRSNRGIWPSDHFPIGAELKLVP